MGARHRVAAPGRFGRSARRIAVGLMVGAAAATAAAELGDGPAGADSSTHRAGAVSVTAAGAPPTTSASVSVAAPPMTVPSTTVPSTTVLPAEVPPTAVPPTTVPVATAPATSSSISTSQPQPAIGAPAGSNPWDDPNAG